MPAIDNLNKAVTNVQAENTLVIGLLTDFSTQVTTLTKQVADLQATIANAPNNDVAIQAAADALAASVASVQKTVDAVTPPTVV